MLSLIPDDSPSGRTHGSTSVVDVLRSPLTWLILAIVVAAVIAGKRDADRWTDPGQARTVKVYSGGNEVRSYTSAGYVSVHWRHGVKFVDAATGRRVRVSAETNCTVE